MSEPAEFECPHCSGRLARGVSLCLHCGVAVEAPPEETSSEATRRFITIGIVLIAIIGAISGVVLSMVTEEKPSGAADNGVKCLPASMGPQIANIQQQGWTEVEPQGDQRCFKK